MLKNIIKQMVKTVSMRTELSSGLYCLLTPLLMYTVLNFFICCSCNTKVYTAGTCRPSAKVILHQISSSADTDQLIMQTHYQNVRGLRTKLDSFLTVTTISSIESWFHLPIHFGEITDDSLVEAFSSQ